MTEEKDPLTTGKLPPIKSKPLSTKPVSYTITAGFNFGCTDEDGDGTRVEPGMLTITLPPKVLADEITAGTIVEVKD
jgi:hypothetical protein